MNIDRKIPEIPQRLEGNEINRILLEAQKNRLALVGEITQRITDYANEYIPKSAQNTASTAANWSPAGFLKMSGEAYKGKTITGEVLSPTDRVIYGVIVALHYAAYGIMGYGAATGNMDMIKTGGKTYLSATILFTARMLPELIKNAVTLAKDPQLIKFLKNVEPIFAEMAKNNIK